MDSGFSAVLLEERSKSSAQYPIYRFSSLTSSFTHSVLVMFYIRPVKAKNTQDVSAIVPIRPYHCKISHPPTARLITESIPPHRTSTFEIRDRSRGNMLNFSFIRLMRRCTTITPQHVQAESDNLTRRIWLREKSFGQRLKLGAGGEICASGAPNDFCRSYDTPISLIHYSDEPRISHTLSTGPRQSIERHGCSATAPDQPCKSL